MCPNVKSFGRWSEACSFLDVLLTFYIYFTCYVLPFFVLFDHITYYVTCGIFPLIYLFLSQDYISCTYTVFQALYLLNVRTTL